MLLPYDSFPDYSKFMIKIDYKTAIIILTVDYSSRKQSPRGACVCVCREREREAERWKKFNVLNVGLI